MANKKPVGAILFSIYLLFVGIVGTALALSLVAAFFIPESQFSISLLSNIKEKEITNTFWAVSLHKIPVCLLYAFLSICMIVSGIGLLRLRDWARKLFMIIAAWDFLEKVINAIVLKKSLTNEIAWLVLDVIILFYLTRPKVRERFK